MESKHYHLVGVAGVGMRALAEVLLAKGHAVSGSDRYLDQGRDLEVLSKLRDAGVRLVVQDGTGIATDTRAVVVSSAIEKDNLDLLAADARGIPVLHRTELLASLAAGKRCIAVSGTSGKTTVTGMIGWILTQLGEDPTVINGGAVLNWVTDHDTGNTRIGNSDTWVLEADESDRSLLAFEPEWAVITNISEDHFDLAETTALFSKFATGVQHGIVCGRGVSKLITVGENTELIENTPELVENAGRWSFEYRDATYEVPLIGRHNAENALAAVTLCVQLGMDGARVRDALNSFKGISRRLECVGVTGGVKVIDDYAHNPAKIQAAWSAVAPGCKRVLGIWRPHGFGPLAAMIHGLAEMFPNVMGECDQLFLLPVYYVGGSASREISSADLAATLAERGIQVQCVAHYDSLLESLKEIVQPGDTILCMGARDPDLPLFARRILAMAELRTRGM